MDPFAPTQLRFPAMAGFTVRAHFDGGAMSSDFGALLLHGVDRQTGLVDRLASAMDDRRHPSYVDHSLGGVHGRGLTIFVMARLPTHLRMS